MKLMAAALTVWSTVGISACWILVFTRIFPVTDLTLGYRNLSMSFLVTAGWMVIYLLAIIFLLHTWEKAAYSGLLTGSSLVFPGLCALL